MQVKRGYPLALNPLTDLAERRAEPTQRELLDIEREWPLIEAEVAVVDAEAAIARADEITELDQRRLRRAKARVTRRMLDFYSAGSGPLGGAA